MSGVETAGLVLGAIPLILAGLEFYAKGIAVTKRYWKYRVEFQNLLMELRTENTMCVNSINMLLISVVRQKDMAEFLADPCGERWRDDKFERKLKDRLGQTSYESYIDTITLMNGAAKSFTQKLKLDDNGKPQFSDENAFKEHYRRLKFSLCKADYNDIMAKIRQCNLSLYRMTTQIISLEGLQASSKTSSQSVPNFNVIHDHARRFSSALSSGWKCSCHAGHSVNLRLEPRMEEESSDEDDEDEQSMRNPFRVLFCYNHHHSKTVVSSGPVAKPWSWEEADVRITREASPSEGTQSYTKPGKKSVKFATEAKKAVKAALDPTNPNQRPIQDLCAAIGELQKPQRDECLSLLATEYAMQQYKMLIYPLKYPPNNPEQWSVSSLRHVLEDKKFTRHDRLRLAVTLASSVLQLHETPWLGENWSKDNIFFVKRSEKTMYDQPFVSQHFNSATPKPPAYTLPVSMSRIIRNQTLYALGISLIELWYRKPLRDLHQSEDGPLDTGDVRTDFMTEWNTADRLVDELYSEAGSKYSDAVRRCIRCDFDKRSSSLEDVAFQKAVYLGVVARLQENYDFLE